MPLNPTAQDKRGVVLEGPTGFLSTDPTGAGAAEAQQVTVSGSGFGLEPNVVFYRTWQEAVSGSTVQQSPPTGEIGSVLQRDTLPQMQYGSVAGKDCLLGYDTGTQLQNYIQLSNAVSASDTDAIQSMNWFVEMSVPENKLYPGRDTLGVNQFSSDSGSKPLWFLGDEGGNSTNSLPDIVMPQHGGGGAFYVWGNSINYGIYPFGSGGADEQDFWAWTDWNAFNMIQDADPAAPQTTIRDQVHWFSSPLVGGQKPTKTFNYTRTDSAAFQGNYTGPDSDCHYKVLNLNSFGRLSDISPELTQLAYGVMYLAASSPPGTENYKQMVFLGDAATLEDCGKRKPKIADSWSDTSVVVSVTAEEAAEFTHVLVYKADKTVTAEAI